MNKVSCYLRRGMSGPLTVLFPPPSISFNFLSIPSTTVSPSCSMASASTMAAASSLIFLASMRPCTRWATLSWPSCLVSCPSNVLLIAVYNDSFRRIAADSAYKRRTWRFRFPPSARTLGDKKVIIAAGRLLFANCY